METTTHRTVREFFCGRSELTRFDSGFLDGRYRPVPNDRVVWRRPNCTVCGVSYAQPRCQHSMPDNLPSGRLISNNYFFHDHLTNLRYIRTFRFNEESHGPVFARRSD